MVGLVLALDLPPKFGIVFSAPDWGYTLFSLGADIALVYLIIDFLLLREERQRWKTVEGKAIELVQGQLQSIFVVVFTMVRPAIDISSSKEEKMSRMRELAVDPAKLRTAIRPLDFDLSSLFQRLSRGIGDLQLRYSSRLDPRLINILIDIENSLASISVSLYLAKFPPIADVKEVTWPPFLQLIAALVKAVDGGFIELPYISQSI
jgi:hypothetical protein